MVDDDKPHDIKVMSVAAEAARRKLNDALELPPETPYATLESPSAMKAIIAGEGQPEAVASHPVPVAPTPVPPTSAPPPPPAEPVTASPVEPPMEPPAPPVPKPTPAEQEASTKAEGKFASFIRNEEGKIRKGPAFAMAAVSLAALGYGIHKLREQKQESPSR